MNSLFGKTLLFLLVASSPAYGLPSFKVTVGNGGARPVFQGNTNPDGTFATATLPPGQYVVQFHSQTALGRSDQYLLVISAGKKTQVSNAIAAEKFAAAGVAVRMDVGAGAKISGQIASEQALAQSNVRMINGKRFFWVPGETGSNFGGRWVQEGAADSRNVVVLSPAEIRKIQDRAGEGAIQGRMHGPELPGHGNR